MKTRKFRNSLIAFTLAIFTVLFSATAAFSSVNGPSPETMNLWDNLQIPLDELMTGGIFSPKNNPYGFRYYYEMGINQHLEGTPYIMVFFLDDDMSCWTEDSVKKFYNKLVTPSLSFLEESAAGYGVDLAFQVGYDATYVHPDKPLRYNGIVEPNSNTRASLDIVDQAACAMGFSSKVEMHRYLQEYSGEEEIIYLFMLNKSGQTHAAVYGNSTECINYNGLLFEYCVIYTGFQEGVENVGNDAVAHEILHLYGAEDYYIPEERSAVASFLCPDDIMLCAQSDVSDYRVCELTAYSVGWFEIVPEAFNLF